MMWYKEEKSMDMDMFIPVLVNWFWITDLPVVHGKTNIRHNSEFYFYICIFFYFFCSKWAHQLTLLPLRQTSPMPYPHFPSCRRATKWPRHPSSTPRHHSHLRPSRSSKTHLNNRSSIRSVRALYLCPIPSVPPPPHTACPSHIKPFQSHQLMLTGILAKPAPNQPSFHRTKYSSSFNQLFFKTISNTETFIYKRKSVSE